MTAVLILVLTGFIGWAAYETVRRFRRGSACCGEHENAVRKTSAKDRRKKHYPYSVRLQIGGMTCENCARKVENAINALEGVWASVSISDHCAQVRCKELPDEKLLREAVRQAGYVVTGYEETAQSRSLRRTSA